MNAITFDDAVRVIGQNLENDNSLLSDFDTIKRILKLLFRNEDIDKAFQKNLSEEEVIEYAKNVVLNFMGDSMTDICKIEIVHDSPLKLHIVANAHFDPDEYYSCRSAEYAIAKKLEIFTGYKVKISL